MSIPKPQPQGGDPEPRSTRSRPVRTRLGRRSVVLLAAGGLLVGTVAVSSVAAAAPVPISESSLTARAAGAQAGTYRNRRGDGSPAGRSSATVASKPASAAQSKAVALIDTVLSDGEAAGTGIVLTAKGEVLTNYHVVEGSSSIRVTIASTGRAYTATVVGADSSADIALLQLKGASGLTTATIDDDTVQQGDAVTAVGNAGGTGELSAAGGTVTMLSTSITTQAEDSVAGEKLTGVIETDADVVPGDSGGPLLDHEGEVLGIDTAASSGNEINGYAIPIADALTIVAQIDGGHETKLVRIGAAAFLGVELGNRSGDDTSGAVLLGVVDGGAAAGAGLSTGDTVTELGSTTIDDAADLTAALAQQQPGTKVTLTWVTAGGTTKSHTVTLGSSPIN